MADPLTLSAVVGLLKVIKEISKCCRDSYKAHKTHDRFLLWIKFECDAWTSQLTALQDRFPTNSSSGAKLDFDQLDTLTKVNGCFVELEKILDAAVVAEDETMIDRSKRYFNKVVTWPLLKHKRVQELLDELNTYKASIMMALEVDTNFTVDEMKKQIKEVGNTIADQNHQFFILHRLKPRGTSPMDTHFQKRRLREAETCDWIFRSQVWKDWLRGGSAMCCRFLFIHGIAGSGKTILASALIDKLLEIPARHRVAEQQTHRVGLSFYYCSHEHNVDETQPLLRWLVYDLSRQLGNYLPESLAHISDGDDMSEEILLQCFFSISKQFQERVYILVDAIDESRQPRERLLKVLTTIGSSQEYDHVSIIMTGRMEPDIKRGINAIEGEHRSPSQKKRQSPEKTSEPDKRRRVDEVCDQSPTRRRISTPGPSYMKGAGTDTMDVDITDNTPLLSHANTAWLKPPEDDPMPTYAASKRHSCSTLDMDNIHVREAIKLFVHRRLAELQSMQNWDEAFTKEIEEKLAQNARGMFRLVSCQIDMLQQQHRFHLYDVKAIRNAVGTMPTTIFDVYKKIVVEWVPGLNGQNHVARNALALICSPTSEIPCADVLVEAARLDVSSNTSLIKFNLQNLRDLLGCLIKVTNLKRTPESVFVRNEENAVFVQVDPAHYTVREFLYASSTREDPQARYFAQTKESNKILELQIAWAGLGHWGKNRPAATARLPTRFEEWCLKMTEKSLRNDRSIIVEQSSIFELVFPCLRHGSPHALQLRGNKRYFPTWVQILQQGCVYQKDGHPRNENTSILVSLMLLDWPELAHKFLNSLTIADRNAIWQDEFSLVPKQKDLPMGSDLVFRPQTTILKACVGLRNVRFLQTLVDSRANFLGEPSIIYYALEQPWGDKTAASLDDGSTTNFLLKCLLDAGADPCPPGYLFTPLQFVITHLEERWVQTLVHGIHYRNKDINMVGSPEGEHPFPNRAEDDEDEDQWWYDHHPLDICKFVIPTWVGEDGNREDEANNARHQILLMLRQFGAFKAEKTEPVGARSAGLVVNAITIDDD